MWKCTTDLWLRKSESVQWKIRLSHLTKTFQNYFKMKNFSERKKEAREFSKLINILPTLLEKILYLVVLITFIKCLLNSNV